MKKSTRILSLVLAMMMLLGTFSVFGSAYQAYKGDAVTFDDIDAATFTTEQYASMGLDEVDRMLAEEQLSVYIYIGTLDVTSIDNAIASVESLLASVNSLLGLLGDAKNLSIESLRGKRRNGTYAVDADLEIVYSVFDFLYNNAGILENYANGSLSLGILNSFVADYVFNVRELLTGLIFGATEAGKEIDYDYFDDGTTGIPAAYLNANNGVLNLLQGLINDLVLGTWQKLDPYFETPYDDHDEVKPEFYAFKDSSNNDVSNAAIDTDQYDYYGWVHPKQWVTIGLGGAKRVTNGAAVPSPDYTLLDITGNEMAYNFIEALLQRAFNYVLVPVLNRDTAPWLKKQCGYEFPAEKTTKKIYNEATGEWDDNLSYVENFGGIAPEGIENNALYNLFETENLVINKVTIPAGSTLVAELNNILGTFIDSICKYERGQQVEFKGGTYSWNWVNGGNENLFSNICNVAKFVLELTGDEFFGSQIKVKTPEEIKTMSDQQVVAYVIRAILNSSVDWMYIDDTYQSVAEVGYRAVEQLAWQDIPQITYTKPEKGQMSDAQYYDALVEKALTILFDVAAYRLNQEIDMNKAEGSNPKAGAGLIPYQGDTGSYTNSLVMIAEWAIQTYGRALAIELNLETSGSHSANEFWTDIDTIFNSIIPIKGNESILSSDISSKPYVFKSLIFDNILKPIYGLNATNFAKIFDRNNNGIFATQNGIKVILRILDNVFDLLFPNVFDNNATTIDGLLVNAKLGAMIYDLASEFGRNAASRKSKTNGGDLVSRTADLVYVALPIVCQVLGLSDDQEFGELECYMPGTISSATSSTTFLIYNGSSGINTGYTSANGTVTKDSSYTYVITQAYAKGYKGGTTSDITVSRNGSTIAGGKSLPITLSGYENGMIIEFNVVYNVLDETGSEMTDSTLTSTSYAYVGTASKDDDAIEIEEKLGNNKIVKYEKEIYIPTNASFSKVKDYTLRFVDTDENKETYKDYTQEQLQNVPATGSVTVTSVVCQRTDYPFAVKNTTEATNKASFIGMGGTYFVSPFEIAMKDSENEYERFAVTYQKDEDGNYLLDENDERIPVDGGNQGVPAGDYKIITTLNVAGTTKTIETTVHIYDDFGLDGAFKRAASMNRQSTNYNQTLNNGAAAGLWNTYVAALKNAASIALKPKTGASFQSDIGFQTTEGFINLYEKYSIELQDAIDALKPYELSSGTSAIEAELEKYSGFNYDTVTVRYEGNDYNFRINRDWDDDNYIYFGYEDFVPHTYNRYKAARNSALGLVESQTYFCTPDVLKYNEATGTYSINPEASDEAKARFAKEREAADAFEAPVINSVSSQYAVHMVNLMGDRLIALDANQSKLNIVRGFAVMDANVSYTKDSLDAFTKARVFADEVAAANVADIKPSQVKKATSELVEAWKDLAIGADYSKLDGYLNNAGILAALAAGVPGEQDVYTDETYTPFYEAYQTALQIKEQGLSATEENDRIINLAANDLYSKFEALEQDLGEAEMPTYSVNPSKTFASGGITYTPAAYDWLQYLRGAATPRMNGQTINHTLYGFKESLRGLSDLFVVENGSVEVIANNKKYGSGTVINIKNTNGDIVDSYLVILRGDVDGNATINLNDSSEVLLNYYKKNLFSSKQADTVWKYCAADVNGDGSVSTADSSIISTFYYKKTGINQTYFKVRY